LPRDGRVHPQASGMGPGGVRGLQVSRRISGHAIVSRCRVRPARCAESGLEVATVECRDLTQWRTDFCQKRATGGTERPKRVHVPVLIPLICPTCPRDILLLPLLMWPNDPTVSQDDR